MNYLVTSVFPMHKAPRFAMVGGELYSYTDFPLLFAKKLLQLRPVTVRSYLAGQIFWNMEMEQVKLLMLEFASMHRFWQRFHE